MHYHTLSLDELQAMATTDAGARQYLADNAADILADLADQKHDSIDGLLEDSWHNGYMEGKNDGGHNELARLRNSYLKEIEWAIDRVEKQSDGKPVGNGKRMHDLLQALRSDLSED